MRDLGRNRVTPRIPAKILRIHEALRGDDKMTEAERMYVIFDENTVTGASDIKPDMLTAANFEDLTDNLTKANPEDEDD